MISRVKNYLEETIKTDTALAEKYDANNLNACWKYITDNARKLAKNNCACIEDAVVYKWARDFFIEGLNAKAFIPEENTIDDDIELKEIAGVVAKKPKKSKENKIDTDALYSSSSLFDFD